MKSETGRKSERAWRTLFFLWLLVLLATPSVISCFGVSSISIMVTASVVVLLSAIGCTVLARWTVAKFVNASAVVLFVSWAMEAVGANTGFVFGHYHYTDLFPFHILGVPLLIPFAWLMMLFPAWGVAGLILGGHSGDRMPMVYRLKFAALTGLVLLSWDFYVDPQMVEFGAWVWESPSGYFGTPWLNFLGWWLTGFIITFLVRPWNLPEVRLLMVYTAVWLLQVIALGAIWGQPLAALCGFVTMGTFVILAWNNCRARTFPATWRSFLQKS